jgi:hypothetical protein
VNQEAESGALLNSSTTFNFVSTYFNTLYTNAVLAFDGASTAAINSKKSGSQLKAF